MPLTSEIDYALVGVRVGRSFVQPCSSHSWMLLFNILTQAIVQLPDRLELILRSCDALILFCFSVRRCDFVWRSWVAHRRVRWSSPNCITFVTGAAKGLPAASGERVALPRAKDRPQEAKT